VGPATGGKHTKAGPFENFPDCFKHDRLIFHHEDSFECIWFCSRHVDLTLTAGKSRIFTQMEAALGNELAAFRVVTVLSVGP
jgi:hypothetical protein